MENGAQVQLTLPIYKNTPFPSPAFKICLRERSSQKHIFFLRSGVYPSRSFWCELPSLADISCPFVCLPSLIMELDGTRLFFFFSNIYFFAALSATSQQRRLFPEIMTRFLKIIHRARCEQFHLGNRIIFYPTKLAHSVGAGLLLRGDTVGRCNQGERG